MFLDYGVLHLGDDYPPRPSYPQQPIIKGLRQTSIPWEQT